MCLPYISPIEPLKFCMNKIFIYADPAYTV